MKPRHAAALVLVGWYLMVPPTSYEDREPRVLSDAPLSAWKVLGTYDSVAECQRARMAGTQKAKTVTQLHPGWSGSYQAAFVKSWLEALCMPTDDPRLKEK
jgi:hypothetical protein